MTHLNHIPILKTSIIHRDHLPSTHGPMEDFPMGPGHEPWQCPGLHQVPTKLELWSFHQALIDRADGNIMDVYIYMYIIYIYICIYIYTHTLVNLVTN